MPNATSRSSRLFRLGGLLGLLCAGCASDSQSGALAPDTGPGGQDAATVVRDSGTTGHVKTDAGDAAMPLDAATDAHTGVPAAPGTFVQLVGGGSGDSSNYHLRVQLGTNQPFGAGNSAHMHLQLSGPLQGDAAKVTP